MELLTVETFHPLTSLSGATFQSAIDDTAKGGLTIFWELFTVIPCTPKDFKCL